MKGIVWVSCIALVINVMLVARDIIIEKRASKRILLQAFVIGVLFWVCVIYCTYYTLKIGGLL